MTRNRWKLIVLIVPFLTTPHSLAQSVDPTCLGDLDRSGAVGLPDFAAFHGCLAGPKTPFADPDCHSADMNENGYIDLRDMAAFQNHIGPCTLCEPRWAKNLSCPQGINGTVYALASWDDGSGPALYAGGSFTVAGCATVSNIARWDGENWWAVGGGVNGTVRALTVFDDGTGAALYAGGEFTTAGGAPANRIAKWDGASWAALGDGTDGKVEAMVAFSGPSGNALFVGGSFTSAGGKPNTLSIAQWNGLAWSGLGDGLNGAVHALTIYDDGSGAALHAGGSFTMAGKVSVNRLAKWNGNAWSGLGPGTDDAVYALAPSDVGGESVLIVGGAFDSAGDLPNSNYAAYWNGNHWSSMGDQPNGSVRSLLLLDDGTNPTLYAGGDFTTLGNATIANRVAKWGGASWTRLGSGANNTVFALAQIDIGDGAALVAGGAFTSAGGAPNTLRTAIWDGVSWSGMTSGIYGSTSILHTVNRDDGASLYVGGSFKVAGTTFANNIAKWNGSEWYPLGSGVNGSVWALQGFNDGSGPALFAGGHFTTAGGTLAIRVAKWDGDDWATVGGGVHGPTSPSVICLSVFDDGSGPALHAGGSFTEAGTLFNPISANNIAKWNGSHWSNLDLGVNGPVYSMTVFDDGRGPALFVGGQFTAAGSIAASNIARWDGASWSTVGSGTDGYIATLAVFDHGAGPALYAGGHFEKAGDVSTRSVARWDGSTWSGLDGGTGALNYVYYLAVLDEGPSEALFAAGAFHEIGGQPANNVAKWNGRRWLPLGTGTSGRVFSLAGFDDGHGPAIFAAGPFHAAGDYASELLAKWYRPAPPCLGE